MADKVLVVVSVDPDVETVIKPFAANLATQAKGQGLAPEITGSATVTYNNGNTDGDGTIDA